MSYATPAELAEALGIAATPANTATLQDCLDAAADEIDRVMVDLTGWVPGNDAPPPLVKRVNVNRAVEWYKAPATYNGGVGFTETGTMAAPGSGFGRHAAVLYTLTDTGTSGVA